MSDSSLSIDQYWSDRPDKRTMKDSFYTTLNVNLYYNREKVNVSVARLQITHDRYESKSQHKKLYRCFLYPTISFAGIFDHYSPRKNNLIKDSEKIYKIKDGCGNTSFEYWIEDPEQGLKIANLLIQKACEDYSEVLSKLAEIINSDNVSFSDIL